MQFTTKVLRGYRNSLFLLHDPSLRYSASYFPRLFVHGYKLLAQFAHAEPDSLGRMG